MPDKPEQQTEPSQAAETLFGNEQPTEQVPQGTEQPEQPTPEGEAQQAPPEGQVEGQPSEQPQDSREAFYQQEYNALVSSIKSYDPNYYDQWRQERKPERQKPEQAPPPSQPTAPSFDDYGDFATKNDLAIALGKIERLLTNQQQQQHEQQVYSAWQNEFNQAVTAIDDFKGKHKMPKEVADQIDREVSQFNINVKVIGGPKGYATAWGKEAVNWLRTQKQTQQQAQFRQQAEQQVAQQKMTMQPEGLPAALKTKPANMTVEEKALELMQQAGSNPAAKELFG